MNDLTAADGGQVTVALVGEHEGLGAETFDGGGASRGTAVGGFHEVNVEIVVCQHGTTHGGDTDDIVLNAHFLDHLGDDSVHDAVTATRTIVHCSIREDRSAFVHQIFGFDYIFSCHNFKCLNYLTIFFNASRISTGVGMTPP